MTILSLQQDFTGQDNIFPRLVRMTTQDNLAAITATNYLQGWLREGAVVLPSDMFMVTYNATGTGQGAAGITAFFTPVVVNGAITLQPFLSNNLVYFDVTVGQAALAMGGAVTLVPSFGAQQYRVRDLQLNSGGTNFSGGSGNRLGQVTDGTTAYSVIPAATMQSLVNAGWGITTTLPFPASAAINTLTAAGANLVFSYSGGTTDYTAGSLVISGIAERIV